MKMARFPLGLHGHWDEWEIPITTATTIEQAAAGIIEGMTKTADQIRKSLEMALDHFMLSVWNKRQEALHEALATLEKHLPIAFGQMVTRQSHLLEVNFPTNIDVHLVVDCYSPTGAYSHPMTVDVTHYKGIDLCECILHEATHVADVYTSQSGRRSLKDKVLQSLAERGIDGRTAWNVWHAIIFASSAEQTREFISQKHVDYAVRRGLYAFFNVPDLPQLWSEFSLKMISDAEFITKLIEQFNSGTLQNS
jgi:hypothetical protein